MKTAFSILFGLAAVLVALPVSAQTGTQPAICTKEYRPVCASVQVQCIRAPCYPQYQTFGNACEARANNNATILHEGVCTAAESGPVYPAPQPQPQPPVYTPPAYYYYNPYLNFYYQPTYYWGWSHWWGWGGSYWRWW